MCSETVTTLPGRRVLKPATERAHFPALDAIRGLAALSVVFFHVSWTIQPDLCITFGIAT